MKEIKLLDRLENKYQEINQNRIKEVFEEAKKLILSMIPELTEEELVFDSYSKMINEHWPKQFGSGIRVSPPPNYVVGLVENIAIKISKDPTITIVFSKHSESYRTTVSTIDNTLHSLIEKHHTIRSLMTNYAEWLHYNAFCSYDFTNFQTFVEGLQKIKAFYDQNESLYKIIQAQIHEFEKEIQSKFIKGKRS